MSAARYLHESGDCWDHCQFCTWEDERDAHEAEETDE
jgi:hypothetical protein